MAQIGYDTLLKERVEREHGAPAGEVVRRLRREEGLTWPEIGRRLKANPSTAHRWLRLAESQPQPAPAAEEAGDAVA